MFRVFAVILCFVVLVGWVEGQRLRASPNGPPRCKHTPEHRETFMKLIQELELTDEQQERLRSIRIEQKRSEIEKRSRVAIIRLDLEEMLRGIEVNRSQIEEKVKEIGRIRTELELAKIYVLLRARDVLTDEQLEKFNNLGFPMRTLLPREEPMRFRH